MQSVTKPLNHHYHHPKVKRPGIELEVFFLYFFFKFGGSSLLHADYPLLVRHTWPLLLRAWALERKLRVALSHVESILYIVICIC